MGRVRVAVDAMGGDYAPEEIVKGGQFGRPKVTELRSYWWALRMLSRGN